jgi:hypothetical protein
VGKEWAKDRLAARTDRHRASIRLEDTEPGQGLRVIVGWPVATG